MMVLPKPTLSFTIPSIHDDTILDCRIYHPEHFGSDGPIIKRSAVIAHPYAPMGGCYDDPVVGIIGATMLEHGFVLATFNFRGAGGSKGRTSWTGKAEVADYQSVVGCFVQYLHLLEGGPGNSPRGSNALGSHPFQLILGGYSYGSMIATRLPDLPTIHTVFSAPKHGTAAAEIILRAEHLAAQTNDEMRTMAHSNPQRAGPRQSLDHTLVVGGDESIDHSRRSRDIRRSHDIRGSLDLVSQRISSGLSKKSPPKAAGNDANEKPESTSATSFPGFTAQAYLLVSPLLPPISSLAALPVSRSSNSEDHLAKFRSHPTLAIFGSKDAFTSAKKLRVWASDLQNANPRFRFAEIDGAGHFWHGEDDVKQLIGQLDEWIQELVKDG